MTSGSRLGILEYKCRVVSIHFVLLTIYTLVLSESLHWMHCDLAAFTWFVSFGFWGTVLVVLSYLACQAVDVLFSLIKLFIDSMTISYVFGFISAFFCVLLEFPAATTTIALVVSAASLCIIFAVVCTTWVGFICSCWWWCNNNNNNNKFIFMLHLLKDAIAQSVDMVMYNVTKLQTNIANCKQCHSDKL